MKGTSWLDRFTLFVAIALLIPLVLKYIEMIVKALEPAF